MNYYNEYDKHAAAWLRELIKRGLIPDGHVDERSIADVQPEDLDGYIQCHFFAGIGGWSYALQLAGWPEDEPVWTGSCPCQPFSVAGKGKGTADERHLWPEFFRLIKECRPAKVFGEQVAAKAGREWLDGVSANLEGVGYACGAADLCAAGVNAPHIRQRLYWMADAEGAGAGVNKPGIREGASSGCEDGRLAQSEGEQHDRGRTTRCRRSKSPDCGTTCRLANALPTGRPEGRAGARERQAARCGGAGGLGDTESPGCERGETGNHCCEKSERDEGRGGELDHSGTNDCGVEYAERTGLSGESQSVLGASHQNHWSRFDILPCTDGKARRIEPGAFPLVDGLPRGVVPSCDISAPYALATAEGRTSRLKGYGNAIVPQIAAEFVAASIEATHDTR